MNPTLDLRASVRTAGGRMILYGFIGLIVGVIALAIGAVTGFFLCIAIPILLASPLAMAWGALQLVYPDIQLGHLGHGPARAMTIQQIENEARDPRTMYQKTQRGQIWMTPAWFVVISDDEVMIEQRRNILLAYPHVSRGRYNTTTSIKVRSRSKNYTIGIEEVEQDWFMRTFQSAAPWAYLGYEPRTAQMLAPQLAYEVDQRAMRFLPPGQ